MAHLHTSSNHLENEITRQHQFLIIYWSMFVMVSNLFESGIVFGIAFFISSILSYTSYRMISVAESGFSGEKKAANQLLSLPHSYHVYSNLTINYGSGSSEIDYIIVGPKGVFVLEVKNYKGQIFGKEPDYNWKQYKTTQKGFVCRNDFYNPVKQVSTHVWRLSKSLRDEGVTAWVKGVVHFTNQEAVLSATTKQTPVLKPHESFASYLNSYKPKKELTNIEIEAICRHIESL